MIKENRFIFRGFEDAFGELDRAAAGQQSERDRQTFEEGFTKLPDNIESRVDEAVTKMPDSIFVKRSAQGGNINLLKKMAAGLLASKTSHAVLNALGLKGKYKKVGIYRWATERIRRVGFGEITKGIEIKVSKEEKEGLIKTFIRENS